MGSELDYLPAICSSMASNFGDEIAFKRVSDLEADKKLFVEDGNHGEYRPLPHEFVDDGIPFVRPPNLVNGRIDLGECQTINQTAFERVRKGKGKGGDVVLTHNATVGRVAITKESDPDFVTNPQTTVWRTLDKGLIDGKFLYYFMRSRGFQEQLRAHTGRNATFDYVSLTKQRSMFVPILEIGYQKSIAHILGTLDDKIELNRRMNVTLESMARALFKSWFVDFDPVIDNALAAGNPIPEPLIQRAQTRRDLGTKRKPLPKNIQKLFPDAFVFDDVLGWVPERWECGQLQLHVDVLNGYAFKSRDYSSHGIFVLRTKNFNSAGVVEFLADDVHLPESFLEDYERYLCEPFDYHLIMVGASVGNRGLIQPHQLPAFRNQNMWCFRPSVDSFVSRVFVKYMLDSLIVEKIGLASGSARAFFRKGDFQNHLIGIGGKEIQNAFEELAFPLLKRSCDGNAASESLAKLRDTLLPKLLSGELRIPDAEKLVANSL